MIKTMNEFSSKQVSPISTGGGGYVFENNVKTLFIILMLTHGRVPNFPSYEITQIRQQTRAEGNNVDDFLLALKSPVGNEICNIYCQAKRTIKSSKDNTFQEFITDAYLDFCHEKFNPNYEKLALVCGSIPNATLDAINNILTTAKEEHESRSFFAKINIEGFTNANTRKLLQEIKNILTLQNADISEKEIHSFLQCLMVWHIDLHLKDSFILALANSYISLTTNNVYAVWSMIFQEVTTKNARSGNITIATLPNEITSAFTRNSSSIISFNDAMGQTDNNQLLSAIQESRNSSEAFLAALIGGWSDVSQCDISFVEKVTNHDYKDWKRQLLSLQNCFPEIFVFRDDEWQIIKRNELLVNFNAYFDKSTLTHFEKTVIGCFISKDPNHFNNYSIKLQNNIIETLAILANMSGFKNYSYNILKSTVKSIVESILDNDDYAIWVSLSYNMSTIAEAAPDVFLDLVTRRLCSKTSLMRDLCQVKENDNFPYARNYCNEIITTLQILAWTSKYFMRAATILIRLTKTPELKEKGLSALRDILLPWHPQTIAHSKARKNIVSVLKREAPELIWPLLLKLLPDSGSCTIETAKPKFLKDIPKDYSIKISTEEYWEMTGYYLEQILPLAKGNIDRIVELVEFIDKVSPEMQKHIFLLIQSDDVKNQPEEIRFPLWNKILRLWHKHLKYSQAKWALPEDTVKYIEQIEQQLRPKNNSIFYIPYFGRHAIDLISPQKDTYEAFLDQKELQYNATKKIYRETKLQGLIEFVTKIESPLDAGRATAEWLPQRTIDTLLKKYLATENKSIHSFIKAFIQEKYFLCGDEWIKKQKYSIWTPKQVAEFLCTLPISSFVLSLIPTWLLNHKNLYWEKISLYAAHIHDDCFYNVIDNLLQSGRPWTAISLLGEKQYNASLQFDAHKAKKALFSQNKMGENFDQICGHNLINVLQLIQQSAQLTNDEKAITEWSFIELLDKFEHGNEKTSTPFLYKKLCNDPEFFCEIISYKYHSSNATSPKKHLSEIEIQNSVKARRLLQHWEVLPGTKDDGTFDYKVFKSWFDKVIEKTNATGHLNAALDEIGEVLYYTPASDNNSLWIDENIAALLNDESYEDLRNGYTSKCFNSRGFYFLDPTGASELELAKQYDEKAEEVDNSGYAQFAVALREVAEHYRELAIQNQERAKR